MSPWQHLYVRMDAPWNVVIAAATEIVRQAIREFREFRAADGSGSRLQIADLSDALSRVAEAIEELREKYEEVVPAEFGRLVYTAFGIAMHSVDSRFETWCKP
jgi:acyl-CoA reductase-like NAD-dependent aldehyde dehydrogenase